MSGYLRLANNADAVARPTAHSAQAGQGINTSSRHQPLDRRPGLSASGIETT